MADFLPAYEEMILDEGGYKLTDTPGDRGGMTYAGISRRWHPNWEGWAYIDRGEEPPAQMVRDFYRAEFWDKISGDNITRQETAETIFNFAVNADWRTAAILAQTVVGATPDGKIGPKTLVLLNSADPHMFSALFALAKITRYTQIVKKDRSQLKFYLGWVDRALREVA